MDVTVSSWLCPQAVRMLVVFLKWNSQKSESFIFFILVRFSVIMHYGPFDSIQTNCKQLLYVDFTNK